MRNKLTNSETTHRAAAEAAITPRLERLTYTHKEVQTVTGLSATTLWRLAVRGSLKPIPGIRHKIYSGVAVENFLAGGLQAARSNTSRA